MVMIKILEPRHNIVSTRLTDKEFEQFKKAVGETTMSDWIHDAIAKKTESGG